MRRTAALVAACAVLLGGCSALSGKDAHESPLTPARTPSSSASSSADSSGGARFTDPAAAADVLAAGRTDFETIYTYDYRDLPKYVAAGRKVTTSPYQATYVKQLTGLGGARLRAGKQAQVPTLDHIGLATLSRRTATLLIHGRLTVSSAGNSSPTVKKVTVTLHLRKVGKAWRVSGLQTTADTSGAVPGNAELTAATRTVRSGLERVFGLRRAHFDHDFAAALKHTTGPLRSNLLQSKDAQLKTLTDGGYDLTAEVTGLGVSRADGDTVQVFVVVAEYRIGRQGARSGPYLLNFDVTVQRVGARWLLDNATTIP